jgi:hypothetical protein
MIVQTLFQLPIRTHRQQFPASLIPLRVARPEHMEASRGRTNETAGFSEIFRAARGAGQQSLLTSFPRLHRQQRLPCSHLINKPSVANLLARGEAFLFPSAPLPSNFPPRGIETKIASGP